METEITVAPKTEEITVDVLVPVRIEKARTTEPPVTSPTPRPKQPVAPPTSSPTPTSSAGGSNTAAIGGGVGVAVVILGGIAAYLMCKSKPASPPPSYQQPPPQQRPPVQQGELEGKLQEEVPMAEVIGVSEY